MIVRVYDFLSAEKPKFSQNLVGIVSDVESFKYTRRAYDIGSFEMTIPTHADEAGCIQPDRMLIVGEKLSQTYIASDPTKRIVRGTFLYVTDIEKKDDKITVTGYDLKYLFALRVTLFPKEEQDKGTYGYYVTSGTTFSCISDIINYNIVNATDSDRQIYGMFGITMPVNQINADPPLTGIQDDRYMTRLEPVSTAIFNLLKNCKTHFYDMRLIIDDNAEDGDSYNPHMESSEDKPVIIIDESRYNIKSYTRKDGTSAYKNAIYAVVGSGDDVTVKCVKRPDDTASGVKRKEVVLDVDTDSVAEIDRYALKAAEEYVISDDFEIEPLFMDDETEPELAQKVSIRIDGVEYETVITEITDEYANGKHTQSYVCGDKKLKVLNVLNKATAGNTQKIINNKIDISNKGGVGKICGNGTSEQFNDYSTANIDEITRYSHIVGRNNTITGGDYDTIIGKGNTIKNVLSNSEKGYQGTRYGQGSVVTGTSNTTVQSVNTLVSGRNNYVGRSYWNPAIDSLVVGSSNKINGGMDSSAVIGNANTTPSSENTDIISLSGSIVVGNENKIESGDIVTSTIIGDGNNAKLRVTAKNVKNSMQNSVIIGTGNTNESVQGAYTIGHLNHQYSSSPAIITGKGQFAIGVGLNNGRPNNFVMGYYNKKYENGKELDLPFSFGGGTSDDDRKNLIELDWNGNLWIAGNLNEGGGGYVLPIATKSTLGGVKIGDNISVTADGVISVDLSGYLKSDEISDWAKADNKPTYTANEIGLGNVDNTADKDKPISTATQTALDSKDYLKATEITGQVIDLNDIMLNTALDKGKSQRYFCASASAQNISNRPVSANEPFELTVDNIRYVNANAFNSVQRYTSVSRKRSYTRWCDDKTWRAWMCDTDIVIYGTVTAELPKSFEYATYGEGYNQVEIEPYYDSNTSPIRNRIVLTLTSATSYDRDVLTVGDSVEHLKIENGTITMSLTGTKTLSFMIKYTNKRA